MLLLALDKYVSAMDSIEITKLVLALSYPLGFFCVLLALKWLFKLIGFKRFGGLLGFLAATALIVTSNPKAAAWLAQSLEQQYPQQSLNDIPVHDAIIVLGGGIRIPLPPAQHSQLGAAADRYWYATRLFRAGKAKRIILSGGNLYHQQGFKGETYYAAQLLQEWGVPEDVIAIETSSRTTSQNKENIANYLQQNNIKTALLVTSAMHMPRAYKLFRETSVSITPASADVVVRKKYSPAIFDWIPSVSAMYLSTVALHEYYGIWANQLAERFPVVEEFLSKR